MQRVVARSCRKRRYHFPLLARSWRWLSACNRMAIINHGRVLAAGTVSGLKESENETLEDVFIRLVGHSIEEVERHTEEESTLRRSEDVFLHHHLRSIGMMLSEPTMAHHPLRSGLRQVVSNCLNRSVDSLLFRQRFATCFEKSGEGNIDFKKRQVVLFRCC